VHLFNANDWRLSLSSDISLTCRLFFRVPDAEYLHDAEQNLSYRATVGAGAGHDLIKTPRTELQVSVAPAL